MLVRSQLRIVYIALRRTERSHLWHYCSLLQWQRIHYLSQAAVAVL